MVIKNDKQKIPHLAGFFVLDILLHPEDVSQNFIAPAKISNENIIPPLPVLPDAPAPVRS